MNPPIRFALRAGSALALCISSQFAVLAASDSSPQTPPNGLLVHESKPYVLFMGADVAVQNDAVFSPISEVTDTVIVTQAGGKPVNVPLDKGVSLQVRQNLKVSASSVSITDLNSERAYSKEADPFRKLEGFNNAASGAADVEDIARATLAKAQASYGSVARAGPNQAQQQAELDADQAAVDTTSVQAAQTRDMISSADAKQTGGAYDAIRVSFAVTPKNALAKPYVAIIARIQDPAGKPGQEQPWVHVQSLAPIAAGETRKVNVYEEGMPSGYSLDTCEVHLYDGRNELATNLSAKRVALSKDEMLDFRVIQYIAANNGRTLPAAPATFASDLRSSLSPDELKQACYVRVAKDGRVAATFVDKEGTVPLQDQTLDAALKGLRFKPAIAAGMPIESIVAIRLGAIAGPKG